MPSVVGERPARSVDDALELLFQASRTRAKQRQVKTSEVIDIICTHAFENGLDDEALRDVVHIASKKTELDQTSVTTLVKNLYPARRVSADVVVTVVGSLGQGKGKPSPSTQNGLVKWLAIVHEIIVDPSVLSRLYGVLFGMLDMISIRTSLCHLLSLITRRKHVKPFRIQQLLGLSRSIGNEPALQGLLRIYKDYYPDIILGSASTSRKSFAPRPDPEWQSRILAIQEASSSTNDPTLDHLNGFKVFRKGPKRIKTSAIPDVHTYHAQETSVTLEGIDNAEDFVERLDRIEPPGQLISYLTDPLLQKYIELKPSEITSRRIHLWLATCLDEQYEAARSGTPDEQYLSEILAGLLRHTQYTKALLPITSTFLAEYLPIWNGLSNVDTILGLLSYIPIQPFDDAYPTYFEPTEKALTAQNQNAYENLLHFYRDLLTNWIAAATPSPHRLRPATASHHPHMLHGLVTHVSTLSISLALSLPQDTDTRLTSAILSFYELLCSSSIPNRIPILIPPMHLVYLLIQTPSPSTLTRTISAIASCKSAFDAHPKPIKDYYPSYVTDPLNSCLRDIYNLLWVSRGLVVAENKAAGLLCKPSLREALNVYLASLDHEYAIGTAFGLSHNAWLASLSAAAWRTLEEAEVDMQGYDRHSQNLNWHKGPVSQRSLEVLAKSGGVQMEWERYKIHVLHWLEARGMPGIKELMFATVTDLKSRYNTR